MAVFFTADQHFGDARRLGIDRRPFACRDAMDAAMLARWNEVVGAGDEVWHLGDLARTGALAAEILPRLAGRKHLVAGNNDPPGTRALGLWASVQDYAEIRVDGLELVLCHYALRTWRNSGRGSLNLHGHSHGRLTPQPRQYDVGVDVRDFRPVRLEDLRARRRGAAR